MEKKKISIYTIAETIGVTPATVSYVVNGKYHKVSLKTREKILNEIERVGYVPDVNARSLSSGRSRLIGLFFPVQNDENKNINIFDNPFYTEFISYIEKYNSHTEYDIVLGYKKQDNFIKWAQSRNFDAIIMLGKFPSSEVFKLDGLRVPLIFIDVYEDVFAKYVTIRSDDRYGTYLSTKHLIENGHKNIAFVGPTNRSLLDSERYQGYKDALIEAGIEFNKNYLFECLPSFESGKNMTKQILENNKITGVVCSSDIIAIGLLNALSYLNKKVPDDISVVGFDGIKQSTISVHQFTTVVQGIEEKCKIAMEIINKKITNGSLKPQTIVIKPTLLIKDSVKNLNI